MSFSIICGPAGSGKTTRAIEAFLAALDRGDNPVFIAPSGPDARHFHRQILRSAGDGAAPGVLSGGRVTTFAGLCSAILTASEPETRIIGANERFLIQQAIVDSTNLKALSRSASFDGFVRAFGKLAAELASLGVNAAGLGKILRSWAGGDEWRQGLNKDLFRLLERYEAVLADTRISDGERAQRRVLAVLDSDADALGHRSVIIDGFWDFTPLEHDLIAQLRHTADEVIVTLPYVPDHPAYMAPSYHLKRLNQLANSEPLLLEPPSKTGRSPALDHLAASLFKEEPARVPAAGSLQVLTAAGSRGQAEIVAAEVLRLWREGQDLDGIAVMGRSLGPDLYEISAVMEAYGIPHELAAPLPLALTAVGKTALALLDFAGGSRSRASLLAYLRSPLSDLPLSSVDEFDRHCRRHGIEASGDLFDEWRLFGGRPLNEISRLTGAAAKGAGELGSELCGFLQGLLTGPGPGTGSSAATLKCDLPALESLQSLCQEAGKIGQAFAGNGYHTPQGGDGAVRVLTQAIRQAVARAPAARSRHCVRILDPHRILNQLFDIVFVCGMVEKQFPNLGREDSFFPDSERRELAVKYGLGLGSRERRLDQERFLYFRTLSRARRRAYLCFPYCDKEGKPSISSLFVDDTTRLYDKDSATVRERKIGDRVFPPGEAPTTGEAIRSLAAWSRNQGGDSKKELIGSNPAGLGKRLAACLSVGLAPDAVISDREIISTLEKRAGFQVTGLQTYLRCPFRYFVETVLAPAEITPLAHGLKRGRVIHDILCRFGSQLKRSGLYLNAEATQTQIDEVRRQMSAFIEEEFVEAGSDLATIILKSELEFHLNRYIDREIATDRKLKYFDFEVGFGGAPGKCGGKSNTENVLPMGDFHLIGRLDRVDWEGSSSRALVIDFKSSRSATSQSDFEKRKEIQIPLYILALREAFGLEPVGGEYYALRGDKRAGLYLAGCEDIIGAASARTAGKDIVDREQFEEHLAMAKTMAREAAAGIRCGDFRAQPLDKKDCEWCSLDGVCRLAAAHRPEAGGDG